VTWRFDAHTGVLTRHAPPQVRAREGGSPRHLVFGGPASLEANRQPRFAYLLNELDAAIDVFAFDAERGTLETVQTIASQPPGFSGEPWAADIHLTPDGRFLYTSERRSSTLAAFRVDTGPGANAGHLSLVGHVPTEAQPRGFAISPDGGRLFAVGQLSNRLSRYAIDTDTGELTWRDGCAVGLNPNWVEAITLP
jgi:6-phosphogluconolactonase